MELPAEEQLKHQLKVNKYFVRTGCCSPEYIKFIELNIFLLCVSSSRIHGFRSQGVEAGIATLTITPKDTSGEFYVCRPCNSELSRVRGASPEGSSL